MNRKTFLPDFTHQLQENLIKVSQHLILQLIKWLPFDKTYHVLSVPLAQPTLFSPTVTSVFNSSTRRKNDRIKGCFPPLFLTVAAILALPSTPIKHQAAPPVGVLNTLDSFRNPPPSVC